MCKKRTYNHCRILQAMFQPHKSIATFRLGLCRTHIGGAVADGGGNTGSRVHPIAQSHINTQLQRNQADQRTVRRPQPAWISLPAEDTVTVRRHCYLGRSTRPNHIRRLAAFPIVRGTHRPSAKRRQQRADRSHERIRIAGSDQPHFMLSH